MPNSIVNLDTKWFENESGKYPAVVMGLNIVDMASAEAFLNEAIEKFKYQRMCSPPNTAAMTITIAGAMTAEDFCARWHARTGSDPILKHFMSLMVVADVLHIQGHNMLARVSLIASAN